ncbi:MAG TPA: zinc ABC transporter substrate-binding protein [Lacisediminihabitans sp.]|nr:zinc ABC transporter substrate-binding protein [Lacisediminihabitans sp.]HXD62352.1 zinc ABC transporter substrate-binding protein [Lacisediminihabitans sp.]
MRLTTKATALLAAAVIASGLAGCASTTPPSDDGTISIVASTNVWGDVAKQIGGDAIHVTSIISDPAQDPHSYEANAQVQLALSKADIVIENGGGYDDFVGTLLGGAGNSTARILNAVKISGFDQAEGLNEHVWYDIPTVRKVAARIATSLTALDSSQSATFAAHQKTFDDALAGLEAEEATIKAGPAAGEGVAITEPVPLYLLSASGLVDKTPAAFSEAIEEGMDVAPDVLRKTLALFTEHRVALLAYNEQTGGPETDQVLAAAKTAGVPTVGMTETLPEGKDYLSWMTDNLHAVKAALG